MRIGMPEILAAGSVVLLATSNATVGWVFLGLSILGAALRWGVEIQTAQQAQAAKDKEGEELAKILSEAGKAFGSLLQTSAYNSSRKVTNNHQVLDEQL